MTVGDLIKILSKVPPNSQIVHCEGDRIYPANPAFDKKDVAALAEQCLMADEKGTIYI
jgi:hypothetical protein